MTTNRRTISLYVPAYNASGTLDRCLKAIAAMSLKPDELIVIDDGSTDETVRVARRHPVRVIRHPRNRGLAAARNTAINHCRGDLIAALDSDLMADRDWLARLSRDFEGRRRITGCCGRVIEGYTNTIADRWRATHMRLGFGMRRSYQPRWLYCGISLIRREALVQAGLFNERCHAAYDDVEMSNRLRRRGHTLLYNPQATATHLKRSTPGDVVRGFWGYWAPKNEMEGAYRSLAAATRLMVARQMGIAAFRIARDLRHGRDELLPLDLLIPLVFSVRDLDEMARLTTLAPWMANLLQAEILRQFTTICEQYIPAMSQTPIARLAFPGGRLPQNGTAKLSPAQSRYVKVFSQHLARIVSDMPETTQKRVARGVPAILAEAEPGLSRSNAHRRKTGS